MALLDRWLLDRWDSCARALRSSYDDPARERPTFQNCWSWALKRWLISGRGHLIVSVSPRGRILRCSWAPQGDRGPMWHFEPLYPKKGVAAIWHAFLHRGQPRNTRRQE